MQGIAGVALTPLGGIFEAASKVTEGLDAITSRSHRILRRRRLPLCIRGDHILRPYNRVRDLQLHFLLSQFYKKYFVSKSFGIVYKTCVICSDCGVLCDNFHW